MNTPEPTRPVVLTDRYAQAVQYASTIHADHTRKGTGIAYMSHWLGVSSLVIEAGGNEDQAIAGLLHDAVEDAGGLPRAADIAERFGKTVVEIVLACSDSTDEQVKAVQDWKERKQAYLDRIEDEPMEALVVTIADKVHNARAVVTDLQQHGPEVLGKFNGSPHDILWYYHACLNIAKDREVTPTLVLPLETAVSEISSYLRG
ncbi:MAG: HD domain-containing protein [Candidatus Nanopelagicales bacterium]|nr:HD domain-containing protein [Candidatus Nanopelagicales bacterium]